MKLVLMYPPVSLARNAATISGCASTPIHTSANSGCHCFTLLLSLFTLSKKKRANEVIFVRFLCFWCWRSFILRERRIPSWRVANFLIRCRFMLLSNDSFLYLSDDDSFSRFVGHQGLLLLPLLHVTRRPQNIAKDMCCPHSSKGLESFPVKDMPVL